MNSIKQNITILETALSNPLLSDNSKQLIKQQIVSLKTPPKPSISDLQTRFGLVKRMVAKNKAPKARIGIIERMIEKAKKETKPTPIIEKYGDVRDKMTLKEFKDYGWIGFDKLAAYKTSAVTKAKKVMDVLIKLGYAKPHDFGRGKGKYKSTIEVEGMSINDILENAYNNIPVQSKLQKIAAALPNIEIVSLPKPTDKKINYEVVLASDDSIVISDGKTIKKWDFTGKRTPTVPNKAGFEKLKENLTSNTIEARDFEEAYKITKAKANPTLKEVIAASPNISIVTVPNLEEKFIAPKGFRRAESLQDIKSAEKIKINVGSIMVPKYKLMKVKQSFSDYISLFDGKKKVKTVDNNNFNQVFINQQLATSNQKQVTSNNQQPATSTQKPSSQIKVVDIKHGGWKPEYARLIDESKLTTEKLPDGSLSYWEGNKRVIVDPTTKSRKFSVGDKLGLLNPKNGRYMYSDIIDIKGDKVFLVDKHPTKKQWDNYWETPVDEINKFLTSYGKDFPSKTLYTLKKVKKETKPTTDKQQEITNFKVGDIYYSSWGYGQTNINFYQIIEKKGKKTAVLQELKQKIVELGDMQGKVIPIKNEFLKTEQFSRRLNKNGSFKINSVEYARKWDGTPKSYTSYYAAGGEIPNHYQGKTAKQVWEAWTGGQRLHFLMDHIKDSTPQTLEDRSKKAYNFLPVKVKKEIETHISFGQYKDGGEILNKNELWEIIEGVNWTKDHDSNRISDIFYKLPKNKFKQLEEFAIKKYNNLDNKYRKDWLGEPGIRVSDDGWMDLRAEIVGRGKQFYNNITVKKMQEMVENKDFYENFNYSFQKN